MTTLSTAIDANAVARVTGIKTSFVNLQNSRVFILPQRIAVIGLGASSVTYPTDKFQATNAIEVANVVGFGSPLHLAARELFPDNGDGVGTIPVTFYPIDITTGGPVAASGTITPAGAPTRNADFNVRVGNILSNSFTITTADTVATMVDKIVEAINAVINLPITAGDGATQADLTCKYIGATGNDITIEVIGPSDAGVTFAVGGMSGGAGLPDIDTALNQMGEVWETMVLNCFNADDTTTLDKLRTHGEGRWGALTHKPYVAFTGNTEADVATIITVPEANETDRVNAYLTAPDSNNLQYVVAARQLARIAKLANENPPHDYGSQDATGLTPGPDESQWDYPKRNQAVSAGVSTTEVKDSVINIADVVTFYHPEGETNPAYRYVVDIVKLQNIIFNLALRFNTPEWDGAPLVPDSQYIRNKAAKKPKSARAVMNNLAFELGAEAIISDVEFTKENSRAEINGQDPKRLDMRFPVKLSGNTNKKAIDLDFGFFFGTGG